MKITVITAVYNSEKTIRDCVESVRRQRGVDIEHLIIDGASTDGTLRVLDELGAAYVSEPDRGLYDAINKGLARATGDLVGILNADDVFATDDVLAKVAEAFAADPSLEGSYGDIRFVRQRGGKTIRYCCGRFFRRWMFRFGAFPAHPSIFLRRELFARYGNYSLEYPVCADFELMLRLFVVHGIRTRYLPICTTEMMLGGVSTRGVRSNVEINRQDLRALRANGIRSSLALIYLKYLFKVWGFIVRI